MQKLEEILMDLQQRCEFTDNSTFHRFIKEKVNKAIAELHFLMNFNSCEGCKHKAEKDALEKYHILPDYCKGCSRVAPDRFEAKNKTEE